MSIQSFGNEKYLDGAVSILTFLLGNPCVTVIPTSRLQIVNRT